MGVPADIEREAHDDVPDRAADVLARFAARSLARRVNPDLAAQTVARRGGRGERQARADVSTCRRSASAPATARNAFGYTNADILASQARRRRRAASFASCMSLDSLRVGAGLPARGRCGTGDV